MREKSISKLINSKKGLFHSIIQDGSCQAFPSRGSTLTGAPRDPFHACLKDETVSWEKNKASFVPPISLFRHPSGSNETNLVQASKSTSNKRLRRKRDILLGLPHSEFLGIASTFSGLVLSLLFGITIYNNTSASSINITIPSGSTVLNTLNDGTFSESSVNASALVWTDNYTGYNLTIMGGNSTGALEGGKRWHDSNY